MAVEQEGLARGPRRFENISTVQYRVKNSGSPALPARYVIPSSVVGSVDGSSSLSLPLIDLAGLASGGPERSEIVRQIGIAASEWGFFQIVNHGFPEEAMSSLDREAREFFELPVDVKERGEDPSDLSHGYEGRMEQRNGEVPWLEFLAQWYRPSPATVEALGEKVWPGGNPTFCNAVHEYCSNAERLGQKVMELLAESLGLDARVFSQHFENPEGYRSAWRLHHYPTCPDPSRALGTAAHSDSGILTILKQDAVGGLQVRKGDSFIDVPPVPGALVINVGDSLEAWSNGRFSSAEHRVVVNEKSERFSMVYLIYAAKELLIECPRGLIDDGHPSLYLPFTGGQYRENFERLMKCCKTSRANTLAFALRPKQVEINDN